MTTDRILDMDDPRVQEALDIANEIVHPPQQDTIMDSTQKAGVLQTIIHAILNDEKYAYRQTLRTASFTDNRQSRLAAGAINECERYGAPLSIIMNHIEAQNGERGPYGVRGQSLEALTHYTLNTNYQNQKQKKYSKDKPL